jgi:hypothetical protein
MAVHHFPARADLLEASLVKAAVWPSEWRAVLKRLDEMFPGGAASLKAVDLARAANEAAPAAGRRLDGLPVGAVFRIREVAQAGALTWGGLPEGGCGGGAGLVIHREANSLWTLAVHLPEADAPVLETSLAALLARVSPMVRESFLACREIASAGPAEQAAIRQCWDKAPFGVALITTALRPLVANVIADDLFAVRSLFAPAGRAGRLRPATKAGDDGLQRAVERILENPAARTSVDIGQPWSSERLTVRLESLQRDAGTAFLRRGEGDGDRLIATFHAPGRMATLADLPGRAMRRPARLAGGAAGALRPAEPAPALEGGTGLEAAV